MCTSFFSSRRRHTRWPRDWSSDVCSSDLGYRIHGPYDPENGLRCDPNKLLVDPYAHAFEGDFDGDASLYSYDIHAERSEERRVGKECRSQWSPYLHRNKCRESSASARETN